MTLYRKEKEDIRAVNDQCGAFTRCITIADVTGLVLMQHISNREMQRKEIFGIYNLINSGKTTWYGFAKTIHEQMLCSDKNQKLANILPINSDEYPLPAKRPKNSVLSCEKLENTLLIKIMDWREAF